jgi:hypothetical protein
LLGTRRTPLAPLSQAWIADDEQVVLSCKSGGPIAVRSMRDAAARGLGVNSGAAAWSASRRPLYADEVVLASEIVEAQVISTARSLRDFEFVRVVSATGAWGRLTRLPLRLSGTG